jgi:hypothetical protein
LLVVLPEGNTALSTGVLSGLRMNWSSKNKSAFNCHSTEISQEYLETFHTLSERQWDAIRERDKLKKERNCDFYFVKVWKWYDLWKGKTIRINPDASIITILHFNRLKSIQLESWLKCCFSCFKALFFSKYLY